MRVRPLALIPPLLLHFPVPLAPPRHTTVSNPTPNPHRRRYALHLLRSLLLGRPEPPHGHPVPRQAPKAPPHPRQVQGLRQGCPGGPLRGDDQRRSGRQDRARGLVTEPRAGRPQRRPLEAQRQRPQLCRLGPRRLKRDLRTGACPRRAPRRPVLEWAVLYGVSWAACLSGRFSLSFRFRVDMRAVRHADRSRRALGVSAGLTQRCGRCETLKDGGCPT